MFMANPELSDADGRSCSRTKGACRSPARTTPRRGSRRIRVAGRISRARRTRSIGEGLLARIFQHETDHLDGMLYIDRLDDEGRRDVMAQLRRIEMGIAEPGRTSEE